MSEYSKKPLCKYGANCYQKNQLHLSKYLHPSSSLNSNVPSGESKKRKHSPECLTSSQLTDTIDRNQKASIENKQQQYDNTVEKNQITQTNLRIANANANENIIQDPQNFMKSKFLVQMPDDFFLFWEYCKNLAKKTANGKEQRAENVFLKFSIELVGPFDVLSGKFDDAQHFESDKYLRHYRYYYDPPEFQTIFRCNNNGLHYGYWRDDPQNSDCFVAKNNVDKDCEINIIDDNMFGAMIHFLEQDVKVTPFNKASISIAKKSLEEWAVNHNICLDTFSHKIKARNLRVVSKTFHKAGLVVPLEKKTRLGYRELIESNANLKKILHLLHDVDGDQAIIDNVMEKLQPLITAANIAVDECDFGNAIELGLDLFSCGAPEVHTVLIQLLVNGYTMVNRPEYVDIIKAHLKFRQKGHNLSIL